MKKTILVSIIVLIAVFALTTYVTASDLVSYQEISIDGIDYSSGDTIGIESGATIPIKVVFMAEQDASEVTIKAWIDGYRSEITDKTSIFELVNDSKYTKYLSLTLPNDIDPTEDYTLVIRVSDQTDSQYQEFHLKMQRKSYNVEILDAEVSNTVVPGAMLAVDVVLKNRGMHDLEDVFVKASIPELGIERKVYFGDLNPLDECKYDGETYRDCDRTDAVERRLYLGIPESVTSGVYTLEIEAYNSDSSATMEKTLVVKGAESMSQVLSGVTSKTVKIGEETTYDLILVNSGDTLKVYSLTPGDAEGLIVSVDPIVTVPAGSSETVVVKVKATSSASEGTQVFSIKVEENGQLVKTLNLNANVEKASGSVATSSPIALLTIILVIVFVVLLIVLIVLLTRKPATVETEETSYY